MKRKRTQRDRKRFSTPGMHTPTKCVQERISSQQVIDPMVGAKGERRTLTAAITSPSNESPEDYRARLRKVFTPEMFAEAASGIMQSGSDRDKARVLASVGKYLGLEVPAKVEHLHEFRTNFVSQIAGATVQAITDEAPLPTRSEPSVLPQADTEGDKQADG